MPWLAAAAPVILPILAQIAGGVMGQSAASAAASKIYGQPVGNIRTPYSSAQYGSITMDPSIRRLRNSLLGQYQAMGPQYQSLLTQAGMNSPGFVQSVTDPYRQQAQTAFGDIVGGQNQRGIRGSTFGEQQLADFANTTGRGLSNVTADAIQRSIGMQTGILGQYGENVLAPQNQLNQEQLAQELASLGLGFGQVQALLEQSRIAQIARAGGNLAQGGAMMGIGNILGGALGGGGGGAGAGAGAAAAPTMGGGLPAFS